MHVPVAAVDEDNRVVFAQDKVGFSGQVFYVEAVTESFCVQVLAQPEFRFGVSGFDGGHVAAAGLFVVNVGHVLRSVFSVVCLVLFCGVVVF